MILRNPALRIAIAVLCITFLGYCALTARPVEAKTEMLSELSPNALVASYGSERHLHGHMIVIPGAVFCRRLDQAELYANLANDSTSAFDQGVDDLVIRSGCRVLTEHDVIIVEGMHEPIIGVNSDMIVWQVQLAVVHIVDAAFGYVLL